MSLLDDNCNKLDQELNAILLNFQELITRYKSGALGRIQKGPEKDTIIKSFLRSDEDIDYKSPYWKALDYQEKQELLFFKTFKTSFMELAAMENVPDHQYFHVYTKKLDQDIVHHINQFRSSRDIWTAILDTMADFLNAIVGLFRPKFTPGFFKTSDQMLQEGRLLILKLADVVNKSLEEIRVAEKNEEPKAAASLSS